MLSAVPQSLSFICSLQASVVLNIPEKGRPVWWIPRPTSDVMLLSGEKCITFSKLLDGTFMETPGVLGGCEKCSGSVRAGVRSEESDAALLRIRRKNSSATASVLVISSLGILTQVESVSSYPI
jgi:hypothetical protein